MNSWEKAQEKELLFWQHYQDVDFAGNDKGKYDKLFQELITRTGYDITIFEGGCGAFSPVCMYPFKNIIVMDSLLDKFYGLRCCNLMLASERISGNINKIPLQDKSVDVSVFLNCLDHADTEDLKMIFSETERITKKYICIYTDYREAGKQDICHPFIFTEQSLAISDNFKIIFHINEQNIYSDLPSTYRIYEGVK